MKLTIDELLKMKPAALQARVLAQSCYNKFNGTKPRDEEETIALAIITINRVRKAIEKGQWVFKKEGVRRIEYRKA